MRRITALQEHPRIVGETRRHRANEQDDGAEPFVAVMHALVDALLERRTVQQRLVVVDSREEELDEVCQEVLLWEDQLWFLLMQGSEDPLLHNRDEK